MSIDTSALRELAEAAIADGDFDRGVAKLGRLTTKGKFMAAANPAVVLELLDEVDRLRAESARVCNLAYEWDELTAFLCGVGRRAGGDWNRKESAFRADRLWEAILGKASRTRDRYALSDEQVGVGHGEGRDDSGAVAGFRGDGVERVVEDDERDGWDCG